MKKTIVFGLLLLSSSVVIAQQWDPSGNNTTSGNVIVQNPQNTSAVSILSWQNNIARIRIGGDGVGADNGFVFQGAGDKNLLRIMSSGNIGMGTTNPFTPLHVKSSLDGVVTFQTSDNTWLYTNWMDNGGTRKTWMGLGADLSSFNINVENGTDKILFNGGNVGIGTTSPDSKLSVKSGGQSINFLTGTNSSGYVLNIGVNDDGVNIANNSKIRSFNLKNSDQTIKFLTGTNTSRYNLNIGVNDDGVNIENNSSVRGFNFKNGNGDLMRITHSGNIGIGTITPDAKLAVNGVIHAKEVKIDLVGWPDYVFGNEYELPTLDQVETHIKEKGHLQNIPSAQEVAENGIELGEMNKKLLEKIEELTLYTIAQEKQIQEQNKKNQELEDRLKKIETLLSQN